LKQTDRTQQKRGARSVVKHKKGIYQKLMISLFFEGRHFLRIPEKRKNAQFVKQKDAVIKRSGTV
jgi:hypothetical protein